MDKEEEVLKEAYECDYLNEKGLRKYILYLQHKIINLQPRLGKGLGRGEPKRNYLKELRKKLKPLEGKIFALKSKGEKQ